MTTAPAVDARQHFAAVKALLSTPLNGHVYEYGGVPGASNGSGGTNPGTVPRTYVLLAIERRYVEVARLVGMASRSGWRLTARAVGATPNEVRWAQLAVAGLEGRRITIAGHLSTPITFESSEAPIANDRVYTADDFLTYAF